MSKLIPTIMFGLLLAVGWTSNAVAQALPAESFSKKLVTPAVLQNPNLEGSADFIGVHIHSASIPEKAAPAATDLKAFKKINKIDPQAVKKNVTRPGSTNAPLRAGQVLPMASITKAEADQMFYSWTDAGGGSHTSAATEVAKDPYQMYELLRFVYTNKDFPGPYYSAFTKNDERERKVYYGAIEGGWNITGDVLPSTGPITQTITGAVTVSSGTSTATGNNLLPVYGYYFETVQKTQMIYSASMLGLQNGDQITSLTFYPRDGITFSGGNVKLSLANTTTSSFSSGTALNISVTQVAQTGAITANANQTEWTITFNQPFTYTGNNLLVQIDTEAGQYGNSTCRFNGSQQSNYPCYYSYSGGSRTGRAQFLPQAKFNYQRTVTIDPNQTIGDINITTSSYDVFMRSITVYDENNNVLTSWSNNDSYYTLQADGTTYEIYNVPSGWDTNGYYLFRYSYTSGYTTYNYGYLSSEGPATLTIGEYLLAGHSRVRLVINAMNAGESTPTITVNSLNPTSITSTSLNGTNYEWTINAQTYSPTEYDPDYYLPNKEGYTALIVAVKNETSFDEDNYDYDYDNSYHSTKDKIITYLTNNVDSIKLLTDGLRVGEGSDYSIGTLFNCEGTYNRFFFLGKGQARQKPDVIRTREMFQQRVLGEYVPFRFMFEEFSPTSGAEGSETTDFYSKMMEGNVYNVVHDCRSVIELGHQFSMSGNEGTTPYAMTGMNFFIPDYRLKYWEDQWNNYTFDGRIQNPYQSVSPDGNPALNSSLVFSYPVNHAAWYATYNQLYPPKVGLYKITLDATAVPVAYDYTEGNLNYQVTLTWVSSLNEMSGHDVPQTYTVYYWDPITGEQKYVVATGITDGQTGLTTITYLVEQFEHSYTINYIVHGSPDDVAHDQFVAISNVDGVVIPGWNDFVGLQLDHHESDFVVADMANWYRNFLVVVNEDIVNGLTVADVTGYNAADPNTPLTPMNTFNLYRYEYQGNERQPGDIKIATLTFDYADATRAHYTIAYEDGQDILESKYQRSTMGIPDEGYVRVKGNGDIVIWPNGYHVNFKSITVKNNGTTISSWNAETMNNLPSNWIVSPGSKWEEFTTSSTGDKVGYMEGGGYIAIPNMLNNNSFTNLTVEIDAYGDGAAVTRIAVNDDSRLISNTAGTTYLWDNLSPNAKKAPNRETVIEYFTVCDGQYYAQYLPVFGYYHDEAQHNQMVYPASILGSSMAGKKIKSMTFYPTTGSVTWNNGTTESASGINFRNGSFCFKLANIPSGSGSFNPDNPSFVTATMTEVKTVNMPSTANTSATTWLIEFDQDFTYTGGDLLIDVTNPTTGNWGLTFFTVDVTNDNYYGYLTSGAGNSALNFLPKVTFTYETEGGEEPPGPGPSEPTDGGLLRLHLLMVDQLKAEIPDDNSHADAYGYILRYEPEGGEVKESGSVKVNIEKTEAQVNGYYTLDEIDNDVNIGINHDQGLTMNVVSADVSMDLPEENPDILYYEMQGKKDGAPALDQDYLTKLQYMKNVQKYEEMLEGSPNKGHQYEANETYHYFDASTPIEIGSYGSSFMTYAPSVSTWGIDRRYFEDDGENNTYGAPIWKTGVGKVQLNSAVHERQTNHNNSVNWEDAGGNACSLYILKDIEAVGYLPDTRVSNVEYEPYMFRVFVESKNGKLRPFTVVPAGDGPYDGEHLEAASEGTTTGPICVWSGYIMDNGENGMTISEGTGDGNQTTYIFNKEKVDRPNTSTPWEIGYDTIKDPETGEVLDIVEVNRNTANAMFGALDNLAEVIGTENGQNVYADITAEDLNVFVRFYYVAAGTADGHTPNTRAGGYGAGYGAESPGKSPSPWTAVEELRYLGEIVSQTYYNIQGMVSDRPFDGVNIVVTRYSNGTTSVTKVIR